MPFKPLRILVAYDDADGLTSSVVPRMQELLEARAFEVETLVIDDSPQDAELWEYAGLILGTPSYGLGLRGAGPSDRVVKWVEAQGGLDDVRVAIFSAFQGRAGNSLRNLRQLVVDHGGECIARHGYWLARPEHDEHVLPAECMVRVR